MKRIKNQKGITLVALIITIIVLLILAVVAIRAVQGDGIISHAKNARDNYNQAQIAENGILQNYADYITGQIGSGNDNGGTITNPYNPDGWDIAWACTGKTWNDKMFQKGEKIEGDIIAKFYKTGNKVTPPSIYIGGEIKFPEGDEYHLVFEGNGEMGPLMSMEGLNITSASAWQVLTAQFMLDQSQPCIIPYVTDVVFCKGVKNIGSYAFTGAMCLKDVTIPNTVHKIESYAFTYGFGVESVSFSFTKEFNSENLDEAFEAGEISSVGDYAFYECGELKKVEIDLLYGIGKSAFEKSGISGELSFNRVFGEIGDYAFKECSSLSGVSLGDMICPSSYGIGVFENCTGLKSVTEGNDHSTSIGDRMFYGCTSLQNVYLWRGLGSSTSKIGKQAFENCTSLQEVRIGQFGRVGERAFAGCEQLKSVYVIGSGLKVIEKDAFEAVTNRCNIYVRYDDVRFDIESSENIGNVNVLAWEG